MTDDLIDRLTETAIRCEREAVDFSSGQQYDFESGDAIDATGALERAAYLLNNAAATCREARERLIADAKDAERITLNGYQLQNALEFVAPDLSPDELETPLVIAYRDDFKNEDGSPAENGCYAWLEEYPEEGSIFLDAARGAT